MHKNFELQSVNQLNLQINKVNEFSEIQKSEISKILSWG